MTKKIQFIIQYQYLLQDKWTDDFLSFQPFDDLAVAQEKLATNPSVQEHVKSGYHYRIVKREVVQENVVYTYPETKEKHVA